MARAGSNGTRVGVALAAAALVVGAGGGFAVGRTTATDAGAAAEAEEHDHEPGSIEAIAEQLAADQARDRAVLSIELAEAARTAHDQLGHVLRAMAAAVPFEGAAATDTPAAPAVTSADAATWATDAREAAEALSGVPEGTAEFNVTREALLGAATLMVDTADDLSRALEAAEPAPEALEQVAAQREASVRLWQAGAAQLDGLVVDAGQPHIHLFLDPSGDPDAVPLEFQEPDAS